MSAPLEVAFRHRLGATAFDIAFAAPGGGTVALFGPSGSGKSTIVNVVAGLLRPPVARVAVGGAVLADTEAGTWIAPERRRIGLVFQDARLFPHLTVRGNLRYGARRAPAGPISFAEVVDLLGIGALLDRRPHTLSGGERQRVAIGRALLAQPRLLAMDEPLASLDAARKAEVLPYLARIRGELRLPLLYVSHDLAEVARLADTVVLIESGRVVACGPLGDVTARGDLPIAARDDAGAVLAGIVTAHDAARQLTRVRAAGRDLLVPLLSLLVGGPVRLRVPAREVALATTAPAAVSMHNVIAGQVGDVVTDAVRHTSLVQVSLEGGTLLARVTPDAIERLGLRAGAPVLALVKSVAIEVLG